VKLISAPPQRRKDGNGHWHCLGEAWPELVTQASRSEGHGVIVVLPENREDALPLLLEGARLLRDRGTFAVVQRTGIGSAFARSLAMERASHDVRVVNVHAFDPSAAEQIACELAALGRFVEAVYDEGGARFEPRIVSAEVTGAPIVFDANDVVAVSGGGKGIGFELALHIARSSGARLLLLGRSTPEHDARLSSNLAWLRAAGIRFEYLAGDVTRDLGDALRDASVLLHAAGTNQPALIEELDEHAFHAAIAPKIGGLRNLLASTGERLRLVVTFGSVIARIGLRGEAHYALANEWLVHDTALLARPGLRALCIEWSVWAGGGMGETLGAVESLRSRGVTPIGLDEGLAAFDRILRDGMDGAVIVCGRLGDPPTLRFEQPEWPLLRFVEHPRAFAPNIELVVDVAISRHRDPYVDEHVFVGERLLPAVLGLEAMAQIAKTLRDATPRVFTNVDLRRPVLVPEEGEITLRVASLMRDDHVDVVTRTSETSFGFDHYRASIRFDRRPAPDPLPLPSSDSVVDANVVYDTLLFHSGRFRRVRAYRALSARHCLAEIDGRTDRWFHPYLPHELILGNPGIRDAAIHALQACIPHRVVLPVAVAEIELFAPFPDATVFVHASETDHDGDTFVYELAITDGDGHVLERWRGLRLRAVRARDVTTLPPPLWGPYVEREIADSALRVVAGEQTSDVLLARAAGAALLPARRGDGRPIADAPICISASRDGALSLAVASQFAIGCDVQSIADDAVQLVGDDGRALLSLVAEPSAIAATRVWSARESLKKATGNGHGPLVFDSNDGTGHVAFRCGAFQVDTFFLGGRVAAVAHRTDFQEVS
jgi:enediyne polyketide synthase